MKKILKNTTLILLFFVLGYLYYGSFVAADISLISRVRGKILLQVEKNGEAWYVDPLTDERFYLGRPADAMEIMEGLGVGITTLELEKIPIAYSFIAGNDSDDDGLADKFEDAIGTNKNKPDSDEDGYTDKEEVLAGYNPLGTGKMPFDQEFSNKQSGKILLQVENLGEAWYVNPGDCKRYFLGSPEDAFRVMRELGLGITNKNLAMIPEHYLDTTKNNNYIVENYTVPSPVDLTKRKYSDDKYSYSFEYSNSFKIKKSNDYDFVVFLGDYEENVFAEKKAFITFSYETLETSGTLSDFAVDSKVGAVKMYGKFINLNSGNAYSEEFKYSNNNSYEINTTVQRNDKEFLQILIVSSLANKEEYDKIYQALINSIEFAE